MFVQMRSPFSGQWLKIDDEDGSIVEIAWAAWLDIPHLRVTGAQPLRVPRPPLSPQAIELVANEAAP